MVLEKLTQNGLVYALIAATLRVYAWTVFSIVLYFLFRTFKLELKDHVNFKFHYLFLFIIPFFLAEAIIYSLNLDIMAPIFSANILNLIGGTLLLITLLSIYFYFRGSRL